jgi:Putative zinc-finger
MTGADDLTCRELVELVTDYLEDRLDGSERARFEMHLIYCAPCDEYLGQLRRTLAVLPRLAEEDLEPAMRDDLLRAFRDWKRGTRLARG